MAAAAYQWRARSATRNHSHCPVPIMRGGDPPAVPRWRDAAAPRSRRPAEWLVDVDGGAPRNRTPVVRQDRAQYRLGRLQCLFVGGAVRFNLDEPGDGLQAAQRVEAEGTGARALPGGSDGAGGAGHMAHGLSRG